MFNPLLRIFLVLLSFMFISTTNVNARNISGQELIATARQEIETRLGSGDYDIIPPPNIPEDMEFPDGNIILKADIPYAIRYNTPTFVTVSISAGDQQYATIGLSFIIKKYENVIVAACDISSGELLTQDNVKLQRMDVGRLGQGYLTSFEQIKNLAAKRMLVAGTVINEYNAELPIIIKRNTPITIIAKVGNVTVTALGEAMQNGRIGQIIKVKNINTQKVIFVKIIDSSCGVVPLYNAQSR